MNKHGPLVEKMHVSAMSSLEWVMMCCLAFGVLGKSACNSTMNTRYDDVESFLKN